MNLDPLEVTGSGVLTVDAFGNKVRAILSTIETKAPISLQPVVANNMLFILDDKGRLTAYR